MRKLPIRVRLGLWFSLVFALAVAMLGGVSWHMFEASIYNIQGRELYERVRSVQRFMDSRPETESRAELERAIAETFANTHGGKWLQIRDSNGTWLYRSPHVVQAQPDLPLPRAAAASGTIVRFNAEGIAVLALVKPIQTHGLPYTVEMGMTLNYTREILDSFLRTVLILTPFALLLAGLAGYFMSRKAFEPIMAIAKEARSIDRNSLNRRLIVPESHDEISHLSETLNHMLGRIEAGFRSVREFTANAAHELRTPITVMRTEVDIALCFPRSDREYVDSLKQVQAEAERMAGIIDDLLSLARADADTEILHFQPTPLEQLLEQAISPWRAKMMETGIRLEVAVPAEELIVECDRPGILRILNIFLENAWKHTPEGGWIRVSLQPSPESVSLTVGDSGVGIAAEHLSHIFDRFYRAGKPLHTATLGSGIGLALAKQIAERHGTKIEVHSVLGEGSSFSLALKRLSSTPDTAADTKIFLERKEEQLSFLR